MPSGKHASPTPTGKHRSPAPVRTIGLGRVLVLAAALVAMLGMSLAPTLSTQQVSMSTAYTIWPSSTVPKVDADPETASVELGVQFKSAQSGYVSAIRFYRSAPNTGPHTGTLWSPSGQALSRVTFAASTTVGWQQANLSSPVKIVKGSVYTASYRAPHGRYADDTGTLSPTSPKVTRDLTALKGVFSYANGVPTSTWRGSNYYVDVVFTPAGASTPKPRVTRVPSTTTPASTTATSTSSTTRPTTSSSTSTTRSSTSTSTTTSSTTTTQPAPSTTTTPAAPGGFPGASNTGYRNAPGYTGTLKSSAGLVIQSNTTYTGYDMGSRNIGTSSSPVTNVKFVGCRFKGKGGEGALVTAFGSNISFEWTSFEPANASAPTSYAQGYQYGLSADGAYNTHVEGLTMDHVDMWGFGNAVTLSTSTQAKPVVIRNSWFHDARADGGQDHTDGIGELQGNSMSFVTLDHNTIESEGNTNGIAFQYGQYTDFTVTNNFIGGWGYAVAIGAQGPGPNMRIKFTGNVFSTRVKSVYGPTYPSNFWSGNGNVWRGNTWSSADANNGKYWTPNGVSASDYTG